MSDIIGLIIELSLIVILPTIIPFIVIIIVGNFKYNEKIKKFVMLLLSIIYNGIIGIISPLLFFCLMFLTEANFVIWILSLIFVFAIILLPLNIFMKRKGKINMFIYFIINIIIFIIGCLSYISIMKGSFDL